MTKLTPGSFSQRSSLYRQSRDAEFTDIGGAALAVNFFSNRRQAEKAGLLDLSVLSRAGVRGLAAADHLTAHNLPVPEKPNLALASSSGDLVLRLSNKEFWVLSNIKNNVSDVDSFLAKPLPDKDCYSLFCQDSHCYLMMTGTHLAEIMAKVCGVDLRSAVFPAGSIAQTTVARVSAIVVHHIINEIPCFSILCDATAGEYMWVSLLDAMNEFGGQVVGVNNIK